MGVAFRVKQDLVCRVKLSGCRVEGFGLRGYGFEIRKLAQVCRGTLQGAQPQPPGRRSAGTPPPAKLEKRDPETEK